VVDIQADIFGVTEAFIDDLFNVIPALDDKHAAREVYSILQAIQAFGRPDYQVEPLPRDDLVDITKTLAEGTPNEQLIILGWLIRTRYLTIHLPLDKCRAWTNDIKELIRLHRQRRRVSTKARRIRRR
jgi:hypothetical protein